MFLLGTLAFAPFALVRFLFATALASFAFLFLLAMLDLGFAAGLVLLRAAAGFLHGSLLGSRCRFGILREGGELHNEESNEDQYERYF